MAARALTAPAEGTVNLAKAGSASIAYSTSTTEAHPAKGALEESRKTFWLTTGMFPQELVIKLSRRTPLQSVKLLTVNACKVGVEVSTRDTPRDFNVVAETELPDDGLHLETMSMPSGTEAKFIKLCIHSGHAEFAAVYNVSAF